MSPQPCCWSSEDHAPPQQQQEQVQREGREQTNSRWDFHFHHHHRRHPSQKELEQQPCELTVHYWEEENLTLGGFVPTALPGQQLLSRRQRREMMPWCFEFRLKTGGEEGCPQAAAK